MTVTLDDLKAHLGVTTTKDDEILQSDLDAAESWVADRVMAQSIGLPEVDLATILAASRWYKRRQSPEGVVGWSADLAFRVTSQDPDIDRLLEQHLDYAKVGIA